MKDLIFGANLERDLKEFIMDFRGTICIVNLEGSDFWFVMHLNEFYKMSNLSHTKVGEKLK
jgi:hypothetical protein